MDEGEKEWGKGGRDNCKRRKRREEDGRASLGMDEKEEKRTRWMKGGKKLMGQITN